MSAVVLNARYAQVTQKHTQVNQLRLDLLSKLVSDCQWLALGQCLLRVWWLSVTTAITGTNWVC